MVADIGRVGLWNLSFAWNSPTEKVAETAAELDELGYGAIWYGVAGADLKLAETLLDATSRIAVATGIVNIWSESTDVLKPAYHRVVAKHPGRLLVGIGAGHRELNNEQGFRKPYQALVDYLDELTAGTAEIPATGLALAALGPRVTALAATRTAGSHPYLTTPAHTASAREILGKDALLAPEQKVVVSTDPTHARTIARAGVAPYLAMVNYRNSLLRLDFTADDFADGGSDRLIDALVAWGSPDQIGRRVAEHHNAGADHVSLQVLTDTPGLPRTEWRELATIL